MPDVAATRRCRRGFLIGVSATLSAVPPSINMKLDLYIDKTCGMLRLLNPLAEIRALLKRDAFKVRDGDGALLYGEWRLCVKRAQETLGWCMRRLLRWRVDTLISAMQSVDDGTYAIWKWLSCHAYLFCHEHDPLSTITCAGTKKNAIDYRPQCVPCLINVMDDSALPDISTSLLSIMESVSFLPNYGDISTDYEGLARIFEKCIPKRCAVRDIAPVTDKLFSNFPSIRKAVAQFFVVSLAGGYTASKCRASWKTMLIIASLWGNPDWVREKFGRWVLANPLLLVLVIREAFLFYIEQIPALSNLLVTEYNAKAAFEAAQVRLDDVRFKINNNVVTGKALMDGVQLSQNHEYGYKRNRPREQRRALMWSTCSALTLFSREIGHPLQQGHTFEAPSICVEQEDPQPVTMQWQSNDGPWLIIERVLSLYRKSHIDECDVSTIAQMDACIASMKRSPYVKCKVEKQLRCITDVLRHVRWADAFIKECIALLLKHKATQTSFVFCTSSVHEPSPDQMLYFCDQCYCVKALHTKTQVFRSGERAIRRKQMAGKFMLHRDGKYRCYGKRRGAGYVVTAASIPGYGIQFPHACIAICEDCSTPFIINLRIQNHGKLKCMQCGPSKGNAKQELMATCAFCMTSLRAKKQKREVYIYKNMDPSCAHMPRFSRGWICTMCLSCSRGQPYMRHAHGTCSLDCYYVI